MSDTLAAFGWVLTFVGMVVHLIGVYAGLWSHGYLTWYVPLIGCGAMILAGALPDGNA
jgi:uncharacterized membrane protein YiaA